jgi:hypothetical protein
MQKRKGFLPLILVAAAVVLLLGICGAVWVGARLVATFLPIRASTTQLAGVEATVEVEAPVDSGGQMFPFSDLPGMPVHDVRVDVGVGSPIPVEVVASGEWSTLCAQLAQTHIRYAPGQQIHIELLSDPGATDCPADMLGLPFSFRIPLNMVEMPSGKYAIIVNGVQTDFEWNGPIIEGLGHFPDLVEAAPEGLVSVPVINAHVEFGVGSPIPSEVNVTGEWPSLCSQLAEVKTSLNGQQIDIEVLATPADATCPEDKVGLTFPLRIPLNMVEMQPGSYTVTVNGTQTSFEWPPVSALEPEESTFLRMAYIGLDGNVWLADLPKSEPRMVTMDATGLDTEGQGDVTYGEPRLSSDGKLVAYRRAAGGSTADGLGIDFGLWVTDLTTGESQEVYTTISSGYNWQPGSHLLAYIPELEGGYFTNRTDGPDSSLAKGILGYDADSGETTELVQPERGYALYGPVWSPDGRFLSFDELLYMEGRGHFAYYDLAAGEYISWEQSLGNYSWAPDGEALAFDNLIYVATGEERIAIRSRQSGAVSEFSRELDPGFAMLPAFSPQGDQIAYLANLGGPENQRFTLFVQAFPQGEPLALGEFEFVNQLSWSPDGTRVYFSAGAYHEQTIVEANLLTGVSSALLMGMQPSVARVP